MEFFKMIFKGHFGQNIYFTEMCCERQLDKKKKLKRELFLNTCSEPNRCRNGISG